MEHEREDGTSRRWVAVKQAEASRTKQEPDTSGRSYLLLRFLAAHRAFISWDNRFLPAGVRPLLFGLAVAVLPTVAVPRRRAQRALAAADNLARV